MQFTKRVAKSLWLASVVVASSAAAETRWFVISETDQPPAHNDAYLLPLSDPDAIAQARVLVEKGPGNEVGSIATVKIAAGADGFNRNVLAEGEPLWSWHVAEFVGFSDFAIELCDGWPGFIEDDVDAFIDNTDATVCFWGYTVTAELDEAPAFAINRELRGGWYNPQTPGQGLMLDVSEPTATLFAAWFTYEDDAAAAKLGDEQHRWLTAQGSYVGALAELDLTLTRGGRFDRPDPVENSEPGTIGSLLLSFEDCNHGQVDYQFVDGTFGSFAIERLLPDPGCEPPRED